MTISRQPWATMPFALLVFLLLPSHAAAVTEVQCYVSCLKGGADANSPQCTVVTATGESKPVTGGTTMLRACASARLRGGEVLSGRYLTDRGVVERFAVREPDKAFVDLAPRLKQAVCLEPACAESPRVAAVAGKGIDAVAARRVGEPCRLGLPCGTVLRPAAPLALDLAQMAPLHGQLRVKGLRGDDAQWTLPITERRVTVDGTRLKPGAAYAYSLVDAGGVEVAAGEFDVLSARMQSDVEAEIAEQQRKEPGTAALARIEILVDSRLLWDARREAR